MADATKLPSGKYRKQVYIGKDKNGKRIYESFIADTEAEVKLLAAARRVELDRGIEKMNAPHMMTVGEVIDMYIEDRDGVLADKTIREYIGYSRNYFQGIKSIRLNKLTLEIIQREVSREARRFSPKTVKNAWALVRASIRYAVPGMDFKPKLPPIPQKEMVIPESSDIWLLFEAVEGKKMEIPILLAATCGLRRGEIAALDLKKDFDKKTGALTVKKAISNDKDSNWKIKSTKNYSIRTLFPPDFVIDKLREAQESDYQMLHAPTITTAYGRLRKKLGFQGTFHTLRHYYATALLELGVPDKYAAANMGHSTTQMLNKVYYHLRDTNKIEIAHSLKEHFNSVQHSMQHEQNVNDD